MFTFLHAADLHLDSPLRGLDRYDGAPVEAIRQATRRALENLVSTAIEEAVSFVVIAGDIYDGDWREFNTGLYFVSQMVKLKDAGIPVYAVSGNHDAANRMSKSLPLPENVTVFSSRRPETVVIDDLDVAIHGQSFADTCTTVDLAKDYPPPAGGRFNIGVLHTSLSGREGHDSYAPCSEDCLRAKGYDYWALGHVHQREIVSREPTIAYSGNIQGRHIRESGAKGCLLVTVADDRKVETEFRPLDVFRWRQVDVDVSEAESKGDVLGLASEGLRSAQQQAAGLPLAVRLNLTGQSAMHQSLLADLGQVVPEIRAAAVEIGLGSIWLEKARIRTTPLSSPAESEEQFEGPLAEISGLVNEIRSSAELRGEYGAELSDLMRKLPHDLSAGVRLSDADWWSRVLDEVESRLVTRLRG